MTADQVLNCGQLADSELATLLGRYGMTVRRVADDEDIPGSFWGDSEAGLIDTQLLVRSDTPVHSALHETCHYICMDADRRRGLHTDAGGDYDEENGVCYLQILLADELKSCSSDRLMKDMDLWGYSFRLGSTRAWFERDAEDVQDWLLNHELINKQRKPTFRIRQ
jgi:hypothetical protein